MGLDQSKDMVERVYNVTDAFIKVYEMIKLTQIQFNALGKSASVDSYFNNAPTNGPSKNEFLAAATSLIAIVDFIEDNKHNDNLYKIKSIGSSIRLS